LNAKEDTLDDSYHQIQLLCDAVSVTCECKYKHLFNKNEVRQQPIGIHLLMAHSNGALARDSAHHYQLLQSMEFDQIIDMCHYAL